jgi:polysaccharide pyruvyl transferase CsaB
MIRQLRLQDPDLPITVMTRKPRQTGILTGVSTVHIFNIWKAGRIMKKSKLYISGGGSLIQNATSTRSLLYYLYSIRQAKKAGCKVMMYGCGIGPVTGEKNRRRSAQVLEENVDLIALRDPESLETLRSFGVHGPEIRITADPALLMEGDAAAAERYLEQNGLNPAGQYSLFVLRPWDGTQEKLSAICAAADYGWEKYGLAPLFYSLEPNRDEEITRAAAAMVKAPCRCLPPIEEGAALCGLMGRMGLVVSMRLHALVFACARQTRVAAISYDPKVSGFMSYLGSDCCVELESVTEQELKTMLDRAMAQDDPHQVDHLKTLANENGILAGELLRM